MMTLASMLVAAVSVTGSGGERRSPWRSLGCGDCLDTELWSCSPGPPGLLLFINGKPDCLEIGFCSSKEGPGSHKEI